MAANMGSHVKSNNFVPVIKTSKNWVLPPRPKPGRKPSAANGGQNSDMRKRKHKLNANNGHANNVNNINTNNVNNVNISNANNNNIRNNHSMNSNNSGNGAVPINLLDSEFFLETELEKVNKENSILKVELSKLVCDLKDLRNQVSKSENNSEQGDRDVTTAGSSFVNLSKFNSKVSNGGDNLSDSNDEFEMISRKRTHDSLELDDTDEHELDNELLSGEKMKYVNMTNLENPFSSFLDDGSLLTPKFSDTETINSSLPSLVSSNSSNSSIHSSANFVAKNIKEDNNNKLYDLMLNINDLNGSANVATVTTPKLGGASNSGFEFFDFVDINENNDFSASDNFIDFTYFKENSNKNKSTDINNNSTNKLTIDFDL